MRLLTTTLLCLMLSACATTNQVVEVPKVQPSAEIMKDCPDFEYPKEFTFDEFKILNIKNLGIYTQCKKLNLSKKEFILQNN